MTKRELHVLVDTREPKKGKRGHYSFSAFPEVRRERRYLDVGDFSLGGLAPDGLPWSDSITIERKTMSDLLGSISKNRNRFRRMWERSYAHTHRYLLIEGSWDDLVAGRYRSNMSPHSADATLHMWAGRYEFEIVWVKGPEEGQKEVCRILRKFRRETETMYGEVEDAT